jgi:hypothetical protein
MVALQNRERMNGGKDIVPDTRISGTRNMAMYTFALLTQPVQSTVSSLPRHHSDSIRARILPIFDVVVHD